MEGLRQQGVRLMEMGHTVEVATLDDEAAPFLDTSVLKVHALGPTSGRYGYTPRLVPWLRRHAQEYDAVVINGLWQYHSFGSWRALRGMGVPYFVFTHGMLDPWFKHKYPLKHLKKWLYWPWAEYRVLRDAKAVLFTCEEERLQARKSFWLYRVKEKVVAYGTRTPPQDAERLREVFLAAYPTLRHKRLLLFLSRIHEKKGCDLLVEAFAGAAGHDDALHLVMAGPDQTGWVPRLQAQARVAGVADRITWPGKRSLGRSASIPTKPSPATSASMSTCSPSSWRGTQPPEKKMCRVPSGVALCVARTPRIDRGKLVRQAAPILVPCVSVKE